MNKKERVLRDHFAGLTMSTLLELSSYVDEDGDRIYTESYHNLARNSYLYANAMLEVRGESPKTLREKTGND